MAATGAESLGVVARQVEGGSVDAAASSYESLVSMKVVGSEQTAASVVGATAESVSGFDFGFADVVVRMTLVTTFEHYVLLQSEEVDEGLEWSLKKLDGGKGTTCEGYVLMRVCVETSASGDVANPEQANMKARDQSYDELERLVN